MSVDNMTPEERLTRIEAAIRQLYALECRLKPAKFRSVPMAELEAIVGDQSEYRRDDDEC